MSFSIGCDQAYYLVLDSGERIRTDVTRCGVVELFVRTTLVPSAPLIINLRIAPQETTSVLLQNLHVLLDGEAADYQVLLDVRKPIESATYTLTESDTLMYWVRMPEGVDLLQVEHIEIFSNAFLVTGKDTCGLDSVTISRWRERVRGLNESP
jgi:hypothetical protein